MDNDLSLSVQRALTELVAPLRASGADPQVLQNWLSSLGYPSAITADPALASIVARVEAIGQAIEGFDATSLQGWEGLANLVQAASGLTSIFSDLKQFAASQANTAVLGGIADEMITLTVANWLRRSHPQIFRMASALGVVDARETVTLDPAVVVNGVTSRTNARSITSGSTDRRPARGPARCSAAVPAERDGRAPGRRAPRRRSLRYSHGWRTSWGCPGGSSVARRPAPATPTIRHRGTGVDPDFSETIPPKRDRAAARARAVRFPRNTSPPRTRHSSSVCGRTKRRGRVRGARVVGPTPGWTCRLPADAGRHVSADAKSGPWTLDGVGKGSLPSIAVTGSGVDIATRVAGGGRRHRASAAKACARPRPRGPYMAAIRRERDSSSARSTSKGALYFDTRDPRSPSRSAPRVGVRDPPSDGDGFLAEILPKDGIRAAFDLGIGWASDTGSAARLGASTSRFGRRVLAGHSTVGVHVGLLAQTAASRGNIGERRGGDRAGARVGREARGGRGADFRHAAISASPIWRSASSRPAAWAVDRRAGRAYRRRLRPVDPARGMYAGVLQLSLHDKITLTAYGLIATKMPDGSPGYSLLVFITAEGFSPSRWASASCSRASAAWSASIARSTRTCSRPASRPTRWARCSSRAIPSATRRRSSRRSPAPSPPRKGSYLLGLLARITWFTPTLVQLDLALILEFGARTRLLVLGRVSALLPSRDNDLIRLNLDAMGVLDFDAGTLAARRRPRRLAARRTSSRSPAPPRCARAGAGDANFVLAVGGFNPRFAAPAGFPTLERVAIALCSGNNPRLICDSLLRHHREHRAVRRARVALRRGRRLQHHRRHRLRCAGHARCRRTSSSTSTRRCSSSAARTTCSRSRSTARSKGRCRSASPARRRSRSVVRLLRALRLHARPQAMSRRPRSPRSRSSPS